MPLIEVTKEEASSIARIQEFGLMDALMAHANCLLSIQQYVIANQQLCDSLAELSKELNRAE